MSFDLMVERLEILQAAKNNRELQAHYKELCAKDCIYFINTFGWTYDPRPGIGEIPLTLYDFQEEYVDELIDKIDNRGDLGVEKSRDMGITWVTLFVFIWYWLFKADKEFLLGSKKEENVDKLGDKATLFEKLRVITRNLPEWLLPEGFNEKKHATFLKLLNPKNKNTITGESSNSSFSRSGRYTAIFFDELAFWPFDYAAWGSAGDSSDTRIVVSTPYGQSNQFAELMTSEEVGKKIQKKVTYHWSRHPHKDENWYKIQKTRRSKSVIARELDLSYALSVEGVIYTEFKRDVHVVNEPYEFQEDWDTVGSFDPGGTCGLMLGQIDPWGTLHCFHEIIIMNKGNTELLAEMFNDYLTQLPTIESLQMTCDPAANTASFKTKKRETDIDIFEEVCDVSFHYDKIKRMAKRIQGGISIVKRLLIKRNVQGIERIQIYGQGCPTLIKGMESEYKYKEDSNGRITDTIVKEHPYGEAVDNLRYMCIQFMDGLSKDSADPDPQPPEMDFEV